ncbi:type I-C CRISPR-associated protein Cas5 [Endomicrobiia bacterium]|nr:type I-C CRISPR-associated protein Cas5 [Endomicrobiia bacterium]
MFNIPKNAIEFKVYGKYALFTDPITKLGGEKCSYQIPTYEAIKGITESIYWKPTFIWIIDKVRVMKSIEMEAKGVRTLKYHGGVGLYYYTYLRDVEYQVQAHFKWNVNESNLIQDRIDGKHFAIANRSLENGGRRDIFIGTRECQGYVEPCKFGEGDSDYDNNNLLSFGSMFYNFGYPNETGKKELITRIWLDANMKKGTVDFNDKKNNIKERIVKPMQQENQYVLDKNILKVNTEYENIFGNMEVK